MFSWFKESILRHKLLKIAVAVYNKLCFICFVVGVYCLMCFMFKSFAFG